MAIPGTLGLPELATKPSAPSPGTLLFYTKTDGNAYIQDSTGAESAIGSTAAITSLTGDVTGTGPGATATTVAFVGGQTAGTVAAAVLEVLAATNANVANTIVRRDSSGNFIAGTITATLNGNASTATSAISAINFTGALNGDVTGNQSATVVSFVGGKTASDVANAATMIDDATPNNMASTLVLRDASGNFQAGTITAALIGNVTGNVSGTSAGFTGSLAGDVSGTQSATVVQKIQGVVVNSIAPTDAQIFVFNSTSNQWNPVSMSGDVSINHSGITTIAASTVTGKVLTGYSIGPNTPITAADTILSAMEKIQGQLSAASGASITGLTGDVVATGPGNVPATIQPNVVTNAKLAQAPGNTIKGNNTGSTANEADLTVSQVNVMLGTVTTVGAIDSQAPQANGLDINGNSIYAQSASASNPGMVNTGAQTFGGAKTFASVLAPIFQSTTSNAAASGTLRLANVNAIAWRNSGGTADLLLEPDVDGILQYGGIDLVNLSASQTLTGKTINAPSNTITNITNSNLSGSAGITGANIAASTVTNNNLAQMAAGTVKANTSASPSNPVDTALGTVTENISDVLVFSSSWLNATIGSPTIQVKQAGASQDGYLSSADWNHFNTTYANAITALTGDGTATGPGSAAFTLATVNSSPGTFGSSTAIPTVVVNAKGLVTSVTTSPVIAPAGTLTGTTLASSVINSLIENLGVQNAALNMGANAINNLLSLAIGETSAAAGTSIDIVNSTGSTQVIQQTGYGASTGHRGRYANGTIGSPTAAVSGNILDFISGRGYGATGFGATSTGVISIVAQGTFTDSSMPTGIQMSVTKSGSISNALAFVLQSTGQLQLPLFYTTAGILHNDASGNITSSLINLTSDVTGVMPIANGGTNSASQTNNGVAYFNGTALVTSANFTYGSSNLTLANGNLAVNNASTTALSVNTTSFVVDSTNNAIGIGTAPATTAVVDIVNASGSTKAVQLTGYGSNVGVRGRYANGTVLAPTAATLGNVLEFISGRGYGATGFAAASTGVINIVAGGTFTDSSMPTYIGFSTTPVGAVSSLQRMIINYTGNILMGTSTDDGSNLLQVAGNARIGLQSGSSPVSLEFSNANNFTMSVNPTSSFGWNLPASQGAAGTSIINDGAGNLSWANLNTNIDGGVSNSVYTASQFINGGTA